MTKILFITNKVQLTTVFIVECYVRSRSYVTVQREFRKRFSDREPPAKRTIQENVLKYHNFGTSLNRNKGNSRRSKTARTEENITQVRNLLQNDPRNVSARRNGLGISPATFNRITRQELRWHPCRIIVRHSSLFGNRLMLFDEVYVQWKIVVEFVSNRKVDMWNIN